MERLNKFGVMPVRGELPENILEHTEVYGVPFGAAATVRQNMGDRNRQAENAGVICTHFRTGDVTGTNVGYRMEMSAMAMVMLNGAWSMMISETPWAHLGDEGNVVEGDAAMTYLSGNGKDPRVGMTRKGYVRNADGGYSMGDIPVPSRPDGGLKPNTDYYLTQRCVRTEGNLTPINSVYVGTDDSEHGGERLIENTDFIEAGVGIPFALGNLTGVFIPD